MSVNASANLLSHTATKDFYKDLLLNLPDFIFQMNINALGKYSFPFLNQALISEFGITDTHTNQCVLGKLKNIVAPTYWDNFLQSINEAKESLQQWSHDFEVILSSGNRWLRGLANVERTQNGSVIFYGRLTDITKLKERENAEKLAEKRVQFALEASTKGVWDLDLVNNKVFYSSQSMKMLHFGDSETIDTHSKWDDRIHPEDRSNYETDFLEHLANKTPYYENAKRMIALDGTYKWILSRGKVIQRDSDGKPLRLVGTHTDITLQKEREQQLTNTLEIVSAQNSRLLNFAHIVSHNLRSHAGNFATLLQIINEEQTDEGKSETFHHLNSTSDALTATIGHLNDLVNIHIGVNHQSEMLNINDYLNKVLVILREEIAANQVIITNQIPASATVQFNPAYLESILLNFTTNAIKYSSPDRLPHITYSLEQSDEVKSLLIKDNGLGIDLEKHGARLFGMYKTFHNNPAARGIGLFITKNQIESMGGSVEIDSKEGCGTTFKINFNEKI